MMQYNLNDTTTPALLKCTRHYRETIQYIIRNKLFASVLWRNRLNRAYDKLEKAQAVWDCEHEDPLCPEHQIPRQWVENGGHGYYCCPEPIHHGSCPH